MNECRHTDRLGAYHDGEMSGPERAELQVHLQGCARCSAELAQLEQLSETLRAAARPALSGAALARLHRSADRQTMTPILHMAELFLAVAASILLVAGAWLFLQTQTHEASAETPSWDTVATTSLDTAATVQDPSLQWIDEVFSEEGGQ
jgi:anti-sigma factor RsiW